MKEVTKTMTGDSATPKSVPWLFAFCLFKAVSEQTEEMLKNIRELLEDGQAKDYVEEQIELCDHMVEEAMMWALNVSFTIIANPTAEERAFLERVQKAQRAKAH